MRVADENARLWYLNEASREGWSTRTLDRNISTQYYNRLLAAPDKEAVIAEMKDKTAAFARFSVLHDNNNLYMSKYLIYLPTKEQLQFEIERQKDIYRLQQEERENG